MLVNVNFIKDHEIASMIASLNGNETGVKYIQTGIYEIGHFSFDMLLQRRLSYEETYPDLGDFGCYGVCDNYKQILEQCQELKNPDRKFVISITPIRKVNQSPSGGWRWHKWGDYIGTKTPTCEYLYDEPEIDQVYCFHIYEIIIFMR